ncbi:MAG: SEC-C metal-binding domain-containing protein [Myxococcota bacterium]
MSEAENKDQAPNQDPAEGTPPGSHVHGPDCTHDHQHTHAPIRRESAKIGRNDPCNCGSGKKFKKCCG